MLPPSPQGRVPKSYAKSQGVIVPVDLLLDLHNSAPKDSSVRQMIRDYIVAFAESNEKGHWTRGIVLLPDGDVTFDKELHDLAIYRGKQETRIATAQKAFADLRGELDFIASFQRKEKQIASRVATSTKAGSPLVPMAELSVSAQMLQEHSEGLEQLVERMYDGMTNCLTGQPPFQPLLESQDAAPTALDGVEGLAQSGLLPIVEDACEVESPKEATLTTWVGRLGNALAGFFTGRRNAGERVSRR